MVSKKLLKSILSGMLFFGTTISWPFGITDEPTVLYDCFGVELEVKYETYEMVKDQTLRLLYGKKALRVILDFRFSDRKGYLTNFPIEKAI